VAYRVSRACLRCGVCVPKCPEGAIVAARLVRRDGMTLQPVHIDSKVCNDCGVCVSEAYWCPAGAIVKA